MRCKTQGKVQYHNKRLAEKAMLSYYLEKGAEAFGSYQCPFCAYWHITSEYDNRSPQIRHEFRQALAKRQANKKDRKTYDKKLATLPLAEQKKIYAQLNKNKLSTGRKQNYLTTLIHRVLLKSKR